MKLNAFRLSTLSKWFSISQQIRVPPQLMRNQNFKPQNQWPPKPLKDVFEGGLPSPSLTLRKCPTMAQRGGGGSDYVFCLRVFLYSTKNEWCFKIYILFIPKQIIGFLKLRIFLLEKWVLNANAKEFTFLS